MMATTHGPSGGTGPEPARSYGAGDRARIARSLSVGLNLGDLEIRSNSFDHGGRIPGRHSNENDDLAPALSWTGVPGEADELVLVCHDPDAPLTHGFTHWVVYNIPADSDGLDEGQNTAFTQGATDFGGTGYGGPLPPEGHGDHHYFFHLYAIDGPLEADEGLSRLEVLDRIDGRIIEQARVVGVYSR